LADGESHEVNENQETVQSTEEVDAESNDNIKESESSVIDTVVAEPRLESGMSISNDLVTDRRSRAIQVNGRDITYDFIRNFAQDWESFLHHLSTCSGQEAETADPDVVMTLIMCSIMDYWEGPMIRWGQPQCYNGVNTFLDVIENDYTVFCDSLCLSTFPQVRHTHSLTHLLTYSLTHSVSAQ
jgi:hypothetical protein